MSPLVDPLLQAGGCLAPETAMKLQDLGTGAGKEKILASMNAVKNGMPAKTGKGKGCESSGERLGPTQRPDSFGARSGLGHQPLERGKQLPRLRLQVAAHQDVQVLDRPAASMRCQVEGASRIRQPEGERQGEYERGLRHYD